MRGAGDGINPPTPRKVLLDTSAPGRSSENFCGTPERRLPLQKVVVAKENFVPLMNYFFCRPKGSWFW